MKKPSGWRRLTEAEVTYYLPLALQSFENIMAWRKGYKIIGVGRYYCKGISKSNYGYNIFLHDLATKRAEFLDEVYSKNRAILMAYEHMRRLGEGD